MKRVLVTGASGFIGRNALAPLLARGFEVHASRTPLQPPLENIIWHGADLLDTSSHSALMNAVRPTHLLHFAWYAVPGKFWTSPENTRWLEASSHLLRAFADHGGERVVMAGTCAEYDWSSGQCSENSTPLAPGTLYGQCKRAMFEQLTSFAKEHSLSAAWGRIFWLYGPHESPTRLVPAVVRALLAGEVARCTHGEQVRDFLHVNDVAAAFVALLDSPVQGAVNIASGQPVQLKEIVHTIADAIGTRDKVALGAIAAPADEAPRVVADVKRLGGEVGWRQTISLPAGLQETIEWWRAQLH